MPGKTVARPIWVSCSLSLSISHSYNIKSFSSFVTYKLPRYRPGTPVDSRLTNTVHAHADTNDSDAATTACFSFAIACFSVILYLLLLDIMWTKGGQNYIKLNYWFQPLVMVYRPVHKQRFWSPTPIPQSTARLGVPKIMESLR